MRPMRTDREQHLEQEFPGQPPIVTEADLPILAPDLRELARPKRQDPRPTAIQNRRLSRAIRLVVPATDEPTPRELVVEGSVEAKGLLDQGEILAAAPHEFGPGRQRTVDRALGRSPTDSHVGFVQSRDEIRPEVVVAS